MDDEFEIYFVPTEYIFFGRPWYFSTSLTPLGRPAHITDEMLTVFVVQLILVTPLFRLILH